MLQPKIFVIDKTKEENKEKYQILNLKKSLLRSLLDIKTNESH
jgi:hypothetical protein